MNRALHYLCEDETSFYPSLKILFLPHPFSMFHRSHTNTNLGQRMGILMYQKDLHSNYYERFFTFLVFICIVILYNENIPSKGQDVESEVINVCVPFHAVTL